MPHTQKKKFFFSPHFWQILNDQEESTCCGGNVVLVTGSESKPNDFDALMELLSAAVVHTIAFPAQSAFLDLARLSSRGLHLTVPEVDNGLENTAITQAKLTSALLQVLAHQESDAPAQVSWPTFSKYSACAYIVFWKKENFLSNTIIAT